MFISSNSDDAALKQLRIPNSLQSLNSVVGIRFETGLEWYSTKFNNTVLNTVFSDIKKLTMSSKKKERTLIFSMAMGANYTFELISIKTNTPQFKWLNKSFLGSVNDRRSIDINYCIIITEAKKSLFPLFLCPPMHTEVSIPKFIYAKMNIIVKKKSASQLKYFLFYIERGNSVLYWAYVLLTHTVAQSTRRSFRPKTNNQPLKKVLSLVVSSVE